MLTVIWEVMNKTGNRGRNFCLVLHYTGWLSIAQAPLLSGETFPASLVSWESEGEFVLGPRLTVKTGMEGLNPNDWALVGILPDSVQSDSWNLHTASWMASINYFNNRLLPSRWECSQWFFLERDSLLRDICRNKEASNWVTGCLWKT